MRSRRSPACSCDGHDEPFSFPSVKSHSTSRHLLPGTSLLEFLNQSHIKQRGSHILQIAVPAHQSVLARSNRTNDVLHKAPQSYFLRCHTEACAACCGVPNKNE